MSIEDIINRVIELRQIKEEKEPKELAEMLMKLRMDLDPLGLYIVWSRLDNDWAILVNKE